MLCAGLYFVRPSIEMSNPGGTSTTKVCVACGVSAASVGPNRKLCDGCRARVCRRCGGSFIQIGVERPRTFCSSACRDADGYFGRSRRKDRVQTTCDECARPIELLPCRSRVAKYCSPHCGRAAGGRKISALMRARLAAGFLPAPARWRVYVDRSGKTHRLRSLWELDFARFIDARGLRWEYEPRRFILSNGRPYTPDFFVESPLGPCYVELHRVEHIKPGDEEKAHRLRMAAVEIIQQTLAPLVLFGESAVARMRRHI